jgi:transcriptional regulator NrdR family protein
MALVISKRDGRREEFRRDKLMAGIVKACAKRPIPMKDIERLVEEIEADLQSLGRSEIPSSLLGQLVMERLKRLDRVAYIRFASVYQDFKDIDSFEQAVRELRAEAITVNEPVAPFAIARPLEPAEEASGQLSFLSAVGESQPRAKGRRPHAHT